MTTKLLARRAHVARDLPAYAAKAADQVVVGERGDHPLGATLGEQPAETTGDEELGHRHEPVEKRTDAQDDQDDLDDPTARPLRVGNRSDRRDRVQRPEKREAERRSLRDREPDHSEDEQPGDQARRALPCAAGTGAPRPVHRRASP
jgi:hypothetical protein